MKQERVLFICKKRNDAYGKKSIGLYTSAKFIANYLNHHHIDSKVVLVDDSNGIDREVHNYKPTHVVLHALWVPPYKMEELLNLYKNIKWQVRIHSKIPFLAHEGMAMEWIKKYQDLSHAVYNLILTTNSEEAQYGLSQILNMTVLNLPNIYCPEATSLPDVKVENDYLDIGCFGAIRPFKNHLIQAMVAMKFGDDEDMTVNFHVNSDRTEQHGEPVLKNLRALFAGSRHNLVEHPWVEHCDFLHDIAKMDLGMQVSLSETYNIVAADFVHVGVPIIVSPEIDWMPDSTKADPLCFSSIYDALEHSYRFWRRLIVYRNRRYLESSNHEAGKIWIEYLERG